MAIDCATALLVVLSSTLLTRADLRGPTRLDAFAVLWSLVAVALRRVWSRTWLVAVLLLGSVSAATTASPVPLIAMALVMYQVPQRFPRGEALGLLLGTALLSTVGMFAWMDGLRTVPVSFSPGPVAESLLLVAGGWVVGYLVAQQRAYTAALKVQAEQRAAAELAEARRALSDERLRIARELHDVLAHSMSLIAVQAGVANHVAAERPEEVRRALASIEDTSRGALREMRALLGVLRESDDGDSSTDTRPGVPEAPAPDLADLESLAARTAEAGVRVALSVTGARRPLSPGLELTMYRVVQESVTNVVKHAGADCCRVAVDYGENVVSLEITDAGDGGDGRDGGGARGGPRVVGSGGSGHGITGMRERVAMYRGEFHAGPLPGGGFRVTARFPVTQATTSASDVADPAGVVA
ncbi:sensor histidine kinase [Streptacidiphilus fuscans]|uniref:histidine kinase n=1 Tax=Streptacidiphilus fuscans TaxID=2789292 RepID=A0A931AXR3_9ACTN|nr:histidine kinase [Streptacidiphilus fuscans]MBF9066493.1 histidine kinase [Streptacidiphilus fuscans]